VRKHAILFSFILGFSILTNESVNAQLADGNQQILTTALNQASAKDSAMAIADASISPSQRKTDAISVIKSEIQSIQPPQCDMASTIRKPTNVWTNHTAPDLKKNGYAVALSDTECPSGNSSCPFEMVYRQTLATPNSAPKDHTTLKSVLDTFTADLRSPKDKNFHVGVPLFASIDVDRQFWEFDNNGNATRTDVKAQTQPMKLDQQYNIKKCLVGTEDQKIKFEVCSNLHYSILPLADNKGYAVITTQTQLNSQAPIFDDKQQKNAFSGFTAVTLIKEVGDQVQIYDTNYMSSDNPKLLANIRQANKIDAFEKMVSTDQAALRKALASKGLNSTNSCTTPMSSSIQEVQSNSAYRTK
jgi:hypothetical protein